MIQIAVFASGNGTNAESIIKYFQGHLQLKVVLLASNNSNSNALKFLSKGDKVKFTIRFKGREMQHSNLGHELMNKIKEDIVSHGKVELNPKFDGKQIIMVIQPL